MPVKPILLARVVTPVVLAADGVARMKFGPTLGQVDHRDNVRRALQHFDEPHRALVQPGVYGRMDGAAERVIGVGKAHADLRARLATTRNVVNGLERVVFLASEPLF